MLKRLIRWLWPQEAPATHEGRRERYVTPSELEEALTSLQKRLDWEMNEWHEKFSTLHARLAKRQQRLAGTTGQPIVESEPPTPPRPSVLNYRKPWSV